MREVKRIIKSVMARKGIRTGQVAELLEQETLQLSVWLSREDGLSIKKLTEVANAIGCDIALVDRQTNEVYK